MYGYYIHISRLKADRIYSGQYAPINGMGDFNSFNTAFNSGIQANV